MTGTCSAEAKRESARDAVPPIDLVYGDRLCDLWNEYELGVARELVQVERVTLHRDLFVSFSWCFGRTAVASAAGNIHAFSGRLQPPRPMAYISAKFGLAK
jgi:hypothetical protein